MAGFLAHLFCYRLPISPQARQWQKLKQVYQGLQLRVQHRHFTGFPFKSFLKEIFTIADKGRKSFLGKREYL
jgi:hypothetical protein